MWSEIRLLSHVDEKSLFGREEHSLCALQVIRHRLVTDKQRWKLRTNNIVTKNKVHEFKDFFGKGIFFYCARVCKI